MINEEADGRTSVPSFSIYCASKWVCNHQVHYPREGNPDCSQAVEGFTEAVSLEVKPEWNIKFQCVEPGGFRYAYRLIIRIYL